MTSQLVNCRVKMASVMASEEDGERCPTLNIKSSSSFSDLLPSPNDEQASIITASPSVGSVSSSLLAQLKLEDDFLLESKDLMVRVDNPEKHSHALDSYITFRVLTKTTRSVYDSHEYCVRRRYNDFVWLRQKFEESYPTHLVPPLPEKHSMQRLSRFNADFIKNRMMALNKFLTRVADHPVLSFDKNLQLFLVAKPFAFAAHKKEGIGLLGRVSNTFHNLAATYMLKGRAPEFDHLNEYIEKFGDKLGVIERISQRVHKEQSDHVQELREFHPVFTLWSSSENQLGRGLAAFGAAVEKCGNAQQDVVDRFEYEFEQPLREYGLYSEAIKDALKKRDALQIEYELTVEELNNRKLEREQSTTANNSYSIGSFFGKDQEVALKDKQLKIDSAIDSLIEQVEVNNDKVECANANLRSDFERWLVTKQNDLKTMFVSLANGQIDYYQNCLSAWEEAIPLIRDTDVDSDVSAIEKMTD